MVSSNCQFTCALTLLCDCGLSRVSQADLSSGKRLHTTNTIRDGQLLQHTKNTFNYYLIQPEVSVFKVSRLEEVGLPYGMSEIDAFPGFNRNSVQLEHNVSLTKSRLMCWTTFRQKQKLSFMKMIHFRGPHSLAGDETDLRDGEWKDHMEEKGSNQIHA